MLKWVHKAPEDCGVVLGVKSDSIPHDGKYHHVFAVLEKSGERKMFIDGAGVEYDEALVSISEPGLQLENWVEQE